jgi:hypothetical protein
VRNIHRDSERLQLCLLETLVIQRSEGAIRRERKLHRSDAAEAPQSQRLDVLWDADRSDRAAVKTRLVNLAQLRPVLEVEGPNLRAARSSAP